MGTRIPVQNYTTGGNNDDNDGGNLRSGNSFRNGASNEIRNNVGSELLADGGDRNSDIDSEAVSESSLDHRDEASNTDCLNESYKDPAQIVTVLIEDDRSSLESSGSLRNPSNTLTAKDLLPIEDARTRFLEIIVDNFISQHLIEKRGTCIENTVEHGEDKVNKRKAGEVQYEGDPRFALPLMYVANLYATLANEANLRIASLHGLRDKTIAAPLEASGGLYRKLTQKFPKTGSYSFKRRELATSAETKTRFPELVVQEEKRIRFVVANGLDIVEKPDSVPPEDAEWFKKLTGRSEVAVSCRDYKFYNPRHKIRRASLNSSPAFTGYTGGILQTPRQETPSKHSVTVSMARQPRFEAIKLNDPESPDKNPQTALLSHPHGSVQSSDLRENTHTTHPSQKTGSAYFLSANQTTAHFNVMTNSPAKFCDECGSSYLRATSKFCSQCGTKRFGI